MHVCVQCITRAREYQRIAMIVLPNASTHFRTYTHEHTHTHTLLHASACMLRPTAIPHYIAFHECSRMHEHIESYMHASRHNIAMHYTKFVCLVVFCLHDLWCIELSEMSCIICSYMRFLEGARES